MPSVIPSRTRTPLILCLNFTFPRPWNEMTKDERVATLREILGTLGTEVDAICQELAALE